MPLTPEGATRLRKVRDFIVTNPEQFNMEDWWDNGKGCICGHLVGGHKQVHNTSLLFDGATLLGLSVDEALPLFFVAIFRIVVKKEDDGKVWLVKESSATTWPAELVQKYHGANSQQERAEVAAARINAFLWQYGYPPDELIGETNALPSMDEPQVAVARVANTTLVGD